MYISTSDGNKDFLPMNICFFQIVAFNHHFVLFIISLFFSTATFSQSATALIASADSAFQDGRYLEAADIYEFVLEIMPFSAQLLLKKAESCRKGMAYDDAILAYESAIDTDENIDAEYYFWLAELVTMKSGCKKALPIYKIFIEKSSLNNSQVLKAMSIVSDCQKSGKGQKHVNTLKGVNNKLSEYSPFYINSELIYSSFYYSKDSIGVGAKLKKTHINTELEYVFSEFNQLGQHITGFIYDSVNSMYYCSVCNQVGQEHNCKIYYIKHSSHGWSNAHKLDIDADIVTQPYISIYKNDTVLFFSSNLEGGYGGLDLWRVNINDGQINDKPVNLGKAVNSEFDEICPFYDALRETLYYSSNQGYLGGMNIFSYHEDSIRTTMLSYPFNSNYNDMYFSYTQEGNALWVSNRKSVYIDKTKLYLNDIYDGSFHLDPVITKEVVLKDTLKQSLDSILPLTLYFDNDMPDPKSNDSLTSSLYDSLLLNFLQRRDNIITSSTDSASLNAFFVDLSVSKGKLRRLAEMVDSTVTNGFKISLLFKAYTSSSSTNEYNLLLASRRNNSLINYLLAYKNGKLKPYYGTLFFVKQLPIGELQDRSGEVYDISTMKQRRVEVDFLIE